MNQVLPTMLLMTIASRSVRLYVATHAAVRRFVRFALCVDVVNIFIKDETIRKQVCGDKSDHGKCPPAPPARTSTLRGLCRTGRGTN